MKFSLEGVGIEATVAIIAIVIMEVVALMQGIDGKILATCLMLVAGLGGYEIGKKK